MKRETRARKGMILVMTVLILATMSTLVTGVLLLSTHNSSRTKMQHNRDIAYFAADGGINYGMWRVANQPIEDPVGTHTFNYAYGNTTVPVSVKITASATAQMYSVVSTATHNGKDRTITTSMIYNPPASVLDYAYFINNWGWFYGSSITDWGDIRSNGPFGFADYRPQIHGDIYSHLYIEGGDKIRGNYDTYEYASTLTMPNINNFAYNAQLATSKSGTVTQGGVTLIDGALGDDIGELESIYLHGTEANPIVIDGPVAVKGDVIIKGYLTGQGTLYAGDNIYIADDVNYNDGPNENPPDNPGNKIGWILDNLDKDLICFAASENIVYGDHTSSSWWNSVKGWVNHSLNESSEEELGPDGLPGTADDGSPYDLDGDGVIDDQATYDDFDFRSPLNSTYYKGLPATITKRSQYGNLATYNEINDLDGVYYSNHFAIGLMGDKDGNQKGATIYGSLISKNEAIIYSNSLTFKHDPRLDSRYLEYADVYELLVLDLGLPSSEARVQIASWK